MILHCLKVSEDGSDEEYRQMIYEISLIQLGKPEFISDFRNPNENGDGKINPVALSILNSSLSQQINQKCGTELNTEGPCRKEPTVIDNPCSKAAIYDKVHKLFSFDSLESIWAHGIQFHK